MKRRAYIIGTVTLGLIALGVESGPGWRGMVSSAERIHSNFQDLRDSEVLNPVERLVFSIVLNGADAPQSQPAAATVPIEHPRT